MDVLNKVLSTDFEAWNHPLRAKLALPVFAIVGYTVGYFAIPHFVESRLLAGLTTALFGGLVVLLGGVLLALID